MTRLIKNTNPCIVTKTNLKSQIVRSLNNEKEGRNVTPDGVSEYTKTIKQHKTDEARVLARQMFNQRKCAYSV